MSIERHAGHVGEEPLWIVWEQLGSLQVECAVGDVEQVHRPVQLGSRDNYARLAPGQLAGSVDATTRRTRFDKRHGSRRPHCCRQLGQLRPEQVAHNLGNVLRSEAVIRHPVGARPAQPVLLLTAVSESPSALQHEPASQADVSHRGGVAQAGRPSAWLSVGECCQWLGRLSCRPARVELAPALVGLGNRHCDVALLTSALIELAPHESTGAEQSLNLGMA